MSDRKPSTNGTGYFEELATALRAGGMAEREVGVTVTDLTAYLAETDSTAEEEFGPVEEFAARLTGGDGADGGPEEPEATAETWKWTTDIYNDRRLLNVYGAQGWEVERLDSFGRFVCRRTVGATLRWEYRREVLTGRGRGTVEAELAPDGWEPCGQWTYYLYLKRPGAASTGPAATVTTRPGTPRWSFYFGRKTRALLAVTAVSALILAFLYVSGAVEFNLALFIPIALAAGIAAQSGVRKDVIDGAEEKDQGKRG
ncbi:hypothetical protein OIE71_24350 [Streptomyces sp. NBC_01725]|uniref:hypothetical protein n=1 Tax=Streptomyces sp. NBC_01725 TaxID=2975923 RepID=UPI002E2C366C|nr:hypothetical protein [Streptomyces sp. NBC_01725]